VPALRRQRTKRSNAPTSDDVHRAALSLDGPGLRDDRDESSPVAYPRYEPARPLRARVAAPREG
jgi:hypothetical protein